METTIEKVKVTYSNGRGKYGRQYAYIRPAKPCDNAGRRVLASNVSKSIERHFNPCYYWNVGDCLIGANSEDAAWKEYWRICKRSEIRKKIVPITLNMEWSY